MTVNENRGFIFMKTLFFQKWMEKFCDMEKSPYLCTVFNIMTPKIAI